MQPPRTITITRLGPPRIDSPRRASLSLSGRGVGFVGDDVWVRQHMELPAAGQEREELVFEKAGARERLFFDPGTVRAGIVTCGGLCPGLNNVIRSLFLHLHHHYGVREVLGFRNGYLGLNPDEGPRPLPLTREFIADIHKEGGTMLGTSRGPQEVSVMVDTLERERLDMLFCIGGDGTQRGAHELVGEIARRGRPIAVVGIPKTIDNDLMYCEPTFGYITAIEKASEIIHLAHTEAKAAVNGIGLVKVMGRDAGFIACGATLVSQEVNFCLIPEQPFELPEFLAALERRMDARGHAVIVVAEGAGQHLLGELPPTYDASGNRLKQDIGPLLKQEIVSHFHGVGKPIDVKYIDPSYILRSLPACSYDSFLCDQLARRAVDAAMSGRTDMIVANHATTYIHVPIPMAVASRKCVDTTGELWRMVLENTGQPATFAAEAGPRDAPIPR